MEQDEMRRLNRAARRMSWSDERRIEKWMQALHIGADELVFYWVKCLFLLMEGR
jgi:hypothetical protein